jgi:hypothetical protein
MGFWMVYGKKTYRTRWVRVLLGEHETTKNITGGSTPHRSAVGVGHRPRSQPEPLLRQGRSPWGRPAAAAGGRWTLLWHGNNRGMTWGYPSPILGNFHNIWYIYIYIYIWLHIYIYTIWLSRDFEVFILFLKRKMMHGWWFYLGQVVKSWPIWDDAGRRWYQSLSPVGKSPRKNFPPLGSHPWWKYGKSYVTGVIIFLGGLRAEWGMGFWIFSGHIETFQLIN